jgi:hypothetical protein
MDKSDQSTIIVPLNPPATTQDASMQPVLPPIKDSSRTPGLKIFDVLLYPVLMNGAVFAISVAATYLTNKGGMKNAEGKLIYGKVGEFFQNRGEWLRGKFMKTGMNESQADMAKMVAFSFADGSLLAPVVKKFEDNREHIGRAIDAKIGHTPEHDAVYDAEPKQSWGSVLGGRLAAVGAVVPTAVLLDKTGLNDKLFNNNGKKFGEYLAKKPSIAMRFAKVDMAEIGRIAAFEAFYTSVCTAGIYVASRFIAGRNDDKKESHVARIETQPQTQAQTLS